LQENATENPEVYALLTWAKILTKLLNSEWDMSHHLRGLRAGTIAGADDATRRKAVTKVQNVCAALFSTLIKMKECEVNWDAITHIGTENNSRQEMWHLLFLCK